METMLCRNCYVCLMHNGYMRSAVRKFKRCKVRSATCVKAKGAAILRGQICEWHKGCEEAAEKLWKPLKSYLCATHYQQVFTAC